MATFPVTNYMSNAARTEGEIKSSLEALIAAAKQIPGAAQAEQALTISGGSITPPGGVGVLVVDTESAATTDDLANITPTNYPDGACLLLRNSNAARVVVLKHAATGTGQMFLSRNADYVLDDTKKFITLQRRGTDWHEIHRAPARFEMPVVAKAATFTLGKEHHGCLLHCTNSPLTVNVPVAASLGNGFTVAILNDGPLDNAVTIDLSGTETFHGFQVLNLYKNQSVVMVCDGSSFYSPTEFLGPRVLYTSFGSTVFISPISGPVWDVGTLTGNVTTLDLANGYQGMRVLIRFRQDGTGGRTVANPSGSKVAGSLASAANQVSYLDLTYLGSRWEGFWTQIPV